LLRPISAKSLLAAQPFLAVRNLALPLRQDLWREFRMQLPHEVYRDLNAMIEALSVQQPLRIHNVPQMVLRISLGSRRDSFIQFILNRFLRRVIHSWLSPKRPGSIPQTFFRTIKAQSFPQGNGGVILSAIFIFWFNPIAASPVILSLVI
jgi:hypothetical protein